MFGDSPQHCDLGAGQFLISVGLSINRVPLPRRHQSDPPNLRTQLAEL